MPSPRPTKAPVALILAGLLLTSAISARAQETSLQLTAYASTSQAAPGDTLAVSFILKNMSSQTLSSLNIQFFTPPGASVKNVSLPGGNVINGNPDSQSAVIWQNQTIQPGQSLPAVITIQLSPAAPAGSADALVKVFGASIPSQQKIISIQIAAASPTPTPTPTPITTPSPTLTPTPTAAPAPPPNRPPVLSGLPKSITVTAGQVFNTLFSVLDPDGDSITFSLIPPAGTPNFCALEEPGANQAKSQPAGKACIAHPDPVKKPICNTKVTVSATTSSQARRIAVSLTSEAARAFCASGSGTTGNTTLDQTCLQDRKNLLSAAEATCTDSNNCQVKADPTCLASKPAVLTDNPIKIKEKNPKTKSPPVWEVPVSANCSCHAECERTGPENTQSPEPNAKPIVWSAPFSVGPTCRTDKDIRQISITGLAGPITERKDHAGTGNKEQAEAQCLKDINAEDFGSSQLPDGYCTDILGSDAYSNTANNMRSQCDGICSIASEISCQPNNAPLQRSCSCGLVKTGTDNNKDGNEDISWLCIAKAQRSCSCGLQCSAISPSPTTQP